MRLSWKALKFVKGFVSPFLFKANIVSIAMTKGIDGTNRSFIYAQNFDHVLVDGENLKKSQRTVDPRLEVT